MERAYNPQTNEYLFLVNDEWVKPTQEATNPKTGERAFLVGNSWQVVPGQKASAKAAPVEATPAMTDPMGTGLGEAIMAQVPEKKESVLQGMQMPEPAVPQDKVVNPKFIEAMKRNLDAMPA